MILADAPILDLGEIDSTNAEAQRRALAGAVGPLWIRAGAQTAGRGRRGRRWLSAPGNLFCTYLGATRAAPADLALLGFAAALAVADAAAAAAPDARIELKWPNDVLVEGAKLSGVLLESGAQADGALWFALGIGVNVVGAPEGLDREVTSLAALGAQWPAEAVFDALRGRLAHWSAALDAQGFEPVRAAWMARGPRIGASLMVLVGEQRIEGRYEGLGARGALLLRTAGGDLRELSAGEVFAGAPVLEAQ